MVSSGGGLDAVEIANIRQQIGITPHAGVALGELKAELARGDLSDDTRRALEDLKSFAETRNGAQGKAAMDLIHIIDHANPFAWIMGAVGLRPLPNKL